MTWLRLLEARAHRRNGRAPDPDPGVVVGCRSRLSLGRSMAYFSSDTLHLLDSHACTHSADMTQAARQTCERKNAGDQSPNNVLELLSGH